MYNQVGESRPQVEHSQPLHWLSAPTLFTPPQALAHIAAGTEVAVVLQKVSPGEPPPTPTPEAQTSEGLLGGGRGRALTD